MSSFAKHVLMKNISSEAETQDVRKILTVGRYFKKKFGEKVRKIPISVPGFTCPNIDGSVAKGGCIFCRNESFSPVLDKQSPAPIKLNPRMSENPLLERQLSELREQFFTQVDFHSNKFGMRKFLIYFQSFTNTYAPQATLESLYNEAFSLPNVVGISIGTRVDSVTHEILDFLGEWAKSREVWLEYGVQSIYDSTLKDINRGHDSSEMEYWFKETQKRGIHACAHLIYGLPNESDEMMLNTLDTVLSWGVNSLKIHPLYVMSHTSLATKYKRGEYEPITLERYTKLIIESMRKIPPNVVVQRVSAGAHTNDLIAPDWCFDKNIQMRYIRDSLRESGIDY